MTYVVVSFLLGAVLGARWRVFVLVPASLLIVAVAMVAGLSAAESFGWIAFAIMASVASLQGGYLVGAWVRVALFAARPAHAPSGPKPMLQHAQKLRTEP
jgi:membrane protein DedA with SNARE-associated domain